MRARSRVNTPRGCWPLLQLPRAACRSMEAGKLAPNPENQIFSYTTLAPFTVGVRKKVIDATMNGYYRKGLSMKCWEDPCQESWMGVVRWKGEISPGFFQNIICTEKQEGKGISSVYCGRDGVWFSFPKKSLIHMYITMGRSVHAQRHKKVFVWAKSTAHEWDVPTWGVVLVWCNLKFPGFFCPIVLLKLVFIPKKQAFTT